MIKIIIPRNRLVFQLLKYSVYRFMTVTNVEGAFDCCTGIPKLACQIYHVINVLDLFMHSRASNA